MTLAKAGYFGGNPLIIYYSPTDVVMDAYHYEVFTREYESTLFELNNTSK